MTGQFGRDAGAESIPAQAPDRTASVLRGRRGLVGEPRVPPRLGYWNIVEAVVAAGKGSA